MKKLFGLFIGVVFLFSSAISSAGGSCFESPVCSGPVGTCTFEVALNDNGSVKMGRVCDADGLPSGPLTEVMIVRENTGSAISGDDVSDYMEALRVWQSQKPRCRTEYVLRGQKIPNQQCINRIAQWNRALPGLGGGSFGGSGGGGSAAGGGSSQQGGGSANYSQNTDETNGSLSPVVNVATPENAEDLADYQNVEAGGSVMNAVVVPVYQQGYVPAAGQNNQGQNKRVFAY
jgi:hypothetical protein